MSKPGLLGFLFACFFSLHSLPSAEPIRCQLAVIGGGSGGFGAALAAARLGVDVVLVEKGDCLGGTSVRGGVNCWEMGAGGNRHPLRTLQAAQENSQCRGHLLLRPPRIVVQAGAGAVPVSGRRDGHRPVTLLSRHAPAPRSAG